jgi:hypothetical protein
LAISLRSPSHADAFYRNTDEDEARRTALIQRLHSNGFGAGSAARRIRLMMRSWQELYHSELKPGPPHFQA